MRTCPDCNSPIADEALFCGNCGCPIYPQGETPLVSTGGIDGRWTSPSGMAGAAAPLGADVHRPNNVAGLGPGVHMPALSGWAAPDPPLQFSGAPAAPGTCSACGYVNLPGELFCGNCGVQLPPVASVPPPPPTPVVGRPGQPVVEPPPAPVPVSPHQPISTSSSPAPVQPQSLGPCAVCGHVNPAGEQFCANCGVLLELPQPPAPLSESPPPPVSASGGLGPPPSPPVSPAPQAGLPPSDGEGGQSPPEHRLREAVPAAAVPTRSIPSECPVCAHPNPPGEIYCNNCGFWLAAMFESPTVFGRSMPAFTVAPVAPVVLQPEQSLPVQPAPPAVPEAQQTPGEPSILPEPVTHGLAPMPTMPVAVISGKLFVTATNYQIPLPPQGVVTLGRPDPGRGVFPDVDLSNLGPASSSVSREHASLIFEGQQLFIEDKNSTNRTYLNRQVLQPYQRYPVQNGDEIRLGALVMLYYAS